MSIEYYQKVASHAQISTQGAEKQLRKVVVGGWCWVVGGWVFVLTHNINLSTRKWVTKPDSEVRIKKSKNVTQNYPMSHLQQCDLTVQLLLRRERRNKRISFR